MSRKFGLILVLAVLAGVGLLRGGWYLFVPPIPSVTYIDPVDEAENVLSPTGFALTSSAVTEGGQLPKEYTCDGTSLSPPIQWSKAPAGTEGFAVIMHHLPGPGAQHWYWLVYNIPPTVSSLAAGETTIGIIGGNNHDSDAHYAPPCSKGPGPKRYSITVYALSGQPDIKGPPVSVTRDSLLAAIKPLTIDHARLNFIYTR